DNDVTWLDWTGRNRDLEAFVAHLSALRRGASPLRTAAIRHDLSWFSLDGTPLLDADWACAPGFVMQLDDVRVTVDRPARTVTIADGRPASPR
ncbi:hypothetical protein LTR94_031375, partial [Friedmanniomyces endolithicus]